MPTHPVSSVLQQLRRAVLWPEAAGWTDGQLLEVFITHQDGAALEALVRRHGPMVLGVCRRILRNHHDAEDAFQATFLVLARKAPTVRPRDHVAHWLHGVACNTARKARAVSTKRQAREKQVTPMPEPQQPEADLGSDWQPLLDQELNGLPTKYRLPIIICDLEGKSLKEAIRQLGWPQGTVAGRLARARVLLAKRLARRGLVLPAGALAAAFASTAAAGLPAARVSATVQAACQLAAGQTPAPDLVSAQVTALTKGVLRTMLLTKLKFAAVVVMIVAAIGAGGTALCLPASGEDQGQPTAPSSAGSPPDNAVVRAEEPADEKVLEGSGKSTTKEIKVADFTSVEVSSAFLVEIRQGETFRTTISADDNVIEHIKADKKDATLKIHMDANNLSVRGKQRWKVEITMPTLEGLRLSGASTVTFSGFKSGKDFKAHLTGACKLEGKIEAGKIDLDLTGASKAKLAGSAKEAKLVATGASQVNLEDFALGQADVQLSGASSAKVNAKDKLDYRLSGASRLTYQGNPTIGKSEKTGASSVSQK